MLNITVDTKKIPSLDTERSVGYWQNVFSRLVRDKVAMFAALVITCLLIMAIFGQLITPADPYAASIMKRLKPIGFEGYPLGTDELGRDMLSRLMVGARLSLFMGITPVLLAFAIGSSIGIVAGYAGGKLNSIMMRTIDVFYAFPSVLLAIALSGVLGDIFYFSQSGRYCDRNTWFRELSRFYYLDRMGAVSRDGHAGRVGALRAREPRVATHHPLV